MSPARQPRDDPRSARLLVVDAGSDSVREAMIGDLADLLHEGDLLVCNDAATLPASLQGQRADGSPVELRLAGERSDGTFAAVALGRGDWRQRTEDRPPPDPLPLPRKPNQRPTDPPSSCIPPSSPLKSLPMQEG